MLTRTELNIDYSERRNVYIIALRHIELRAIADREEAFSIYSQLLREEWPVL